MLDHVLDATSAEGLALLNGLEWLNKLGFPKWRLSDSLKIHVCDDTKQYATLLRLQVQSVVARVNFPHKKIRGLYRTLRE
jgi:hypothetical protein